VRVASDRGGRLTARRKKRNDIMKKTLTTAGVLLMLAVCPEATRAEPSQDNPAAATGNGENAVDRKAGIRRRTAEDRKAYSAEQLREIESLYQVANKLWNTPEAQTGLKALIEKYPRANRTGCAVQYMGQMSSGEEREKYLNLAIKDFGDCYYGSGVQVRAYARFYLGYHYKENGLARMLKSRYFP
jgi:hypothetical protein